MGDAAGLAEAAQAPSCTTHFCIVDRHGNMCSVTQTLLSIFGSRVVSPSTGLLLNNGIMWFDPVPGRPNSLGPGKRCLGNFCPIYRRSRRWPPLRARRLRRAQDHRRGAADHLLHDRPRPDAGRGLPPAAHRHERRRQSHRRPHAAAVGDRRAGGGLPHRDGACAPTFPMRSPVRRRCCARAT